MILAIDTSGVELLVALVDEGGLVDGRISPGPRHQDRIIELVRELAEERLDSLDALAVARGPGSHTGLRVGLSTAAGIAFARRLHIHPLSSLAVAAHRALDVDLRVLAMVSAGRGRAYVQAFTCRGPLRQPAGERRLETLAGFNPEGSLVAAEPALMAHLAGSPPAPYRTGTQALAAAVLESVGAGERVNYDQLSGDYGDF
jgi:tRNA threonylcarbamoyl adenosine modification protein YeaZ